MIELAKRLAVAGRDGLSDDGLHAGADTGESGSRITREVLGHREWNGEREHHGDDRDDQWDAHEDRDRPTHYGNSGAPSAKRPAR